LLAENKFLGIDWQIVLEDSSSLTKEIGQLKIIVKITYLNTLNFTKDNLVLILDETSFEVTDNKINTEFV